LKLLFDQNLSRKLVSRLVDIFPNASHVQFHELAEKTDTEVWEFAKLNDRYDRYPSFSPVIFTGKSQVVKNIDCHCYLTAL